MGPLPTALLAVLALPTVVAALEALSVVPGLAPMLWEWLVVRKWGKYWPVLASVLPACITIAWKFADKLPDGLLFATVGAILSAVAVVQFYGQERNNRDKSKTEVKFTRLITTTARARREAEQGRAATEDLLIDLLNEIREGRREAEQGRREVEQRRAATEDLLIDLLNEIREGSREARVIGVAHTAAINECGNEIYRIADAIRTLAATAEEF